MTVSRVFLTGGSGFLGARAADALRESGYEVIDPRRIELDLTNRPDVAAAIGDAGADIVIHLASCLDRRPGPEIEALQWRDTFETGKVVLSAAVDAGVRRIIASGSLDEVGAQSGILGPDAAPAPLTVYGLCKALVLEMAHYHARNSGLSVEWFRPTAVYGPGQRGPMLVPAAFATAISDGQAGFTSGEQKRDFIYVDDVVDWILRAVALPEPEPGVVIHHLGSAAPVPVAEVLRTIASLTGADFRLGEIPRRAGEPDMVSVPVYSDVRPPLREWAPRVDLTTGLKRTWEWWQAQ